MRYKFKTAVIDGMLFFDAQTVSILLENIIKGFGLEKEKPNLEKLRNYISEQEGKCHKNISK